MSIQLTKDEAIAIVAAINYACQSERSFLSNEETMSGYAAVQASLRDYFERDYFERKENAL